MRARSAVRGFGQEFLIAFIDLLMIHDDFRAEH